MPRPDTAIRLHALSISRSIAGFLAQPRSGSVIATFKRSCYLDLDGRIVAVVAPELLNGPLNIVAEIPPSFSFDRIPGRVRVAWNAGSLTIEAFSIDLGTARVWNSVVAPLPQAARNRLREDLGVIRTLLRDEAPAESVARIEQRSPRASDGLAALAAGLRHQDARQVALGAERLAGLGPGLTPSGDDALAGALVALAILRPPNQSALAEPILQTTAGTTRISRAYIEAAARGEANDAWHQLLASLGTDDPLRLAATVRRVMAFGETSGADMLAGFVLAVEALLQL